MIYDLDFIDLNAEKINVLIIGLVKNYNFFNIKKHFQTQIKLDFKSKISYF